MSSCLHDSLTSFDKHAEFKLNPHVLQVAADAGQVWVNTKSGVNRKHGSQYYGEAKTGKYMGADDALAAGYHYAQVAVR